MKVKLRIHPQMAYPSFLMFCLILVHTNSKNKECGNVQASEDLDGIPDVVSDPLTHLEEDFPLRPELMGHLIPHQVNVWIGAAKEGDIHGSPHLINKIIYLKTTLSG